MNNSMYHPRFTDNRDTKSIPGMTQQTSEWKTLLLSNPFLSKNEDNLSSLNNLEMGGKTTNTLKKKITDLPR